MTTPNDAPNSELKIKQRFAIQALSEGATNQKAARAAGVDVATVYRWKTQPEFKAALKEAADEVLEQANARLPQVFNTALDALHGIMIDRKAPAAVQGRVCFRRTGYRTQVAG